ncbi:MAG: bifunctional riboflavin kinase/FAD synthetase [Burkholderiaceae bacterium]
MHAFRRLPPLDQRRPCALTIGNFDGVHRGHLAILTRLADEARRRGLVSCVLTFEPHPREYFARTGRGTAPARISTLRDKLEALKLYGVDRVNIAHFNARLAALPAEDFVRDLLVDGLQVRYLLIGDDFRFGAQRRGDFALLRRMAGGDGDPRRAFDVEAMPTIEDDGARISSTAIRQALADGRLADARQLLGRAYCISGHVVHGRKLGRTLGFPTMNVRIPFDRPALSGIFAVRVHGLPPPAGDASAIPAPIDGVASLGTRPAVEAHGRPLLEVHLFDFDRNVYGEIVRVEFVRKLRDERHFDSLDALTVQIDADARQARDVLRQP